MSDKDLKIELTANWDAIDEIVNLPGLSESFPVSCGTRKEISATRAMSR